MSVPSGLLGPLMEAAFMTGRFAEAVSNLHSCESPLRYPWPLDPNCDACKKTMQRFVDSNHLEMSYRLFGFQAIHDHMDVDNIRRAKIAWERKCAREAKENTSDLAIVAEPT